MAPAIPALACSASFMNSFSTSSEMAAGVVLHTEAITLMGLPSATMRSSSSSLGSRSPVSVIGVTIASTILGSSIEPPPATSRMARASWSPSATRSLSR